MAGLAASKVSNWRQRANQAGFFGLAVVFPLLSGCAVVSVVSTAVTVAVGVVSTAVDVGVGAAKVTGKVIGKGVDVVTGSGSPAPPSASNISKSQSN